MGLSTEKYVSERHEQAVERGLITAGQLSKLIQKQQKIKIYAAELKEFADEWHHSGFYKKAGSSVMGRTYFFSQKRVEEMLQKDWATWKKEKEDKTKAEKSIAERKRKIKKWGFYTDWHVEYTGRFGKKRNVNRLHFLKTNAYEIEFSKAIEITEKEYKEYKHYEGIEVGYEGITKSQLLAKTPMSELKRLERNRKRREAYQKRKAEKERAAKEKAEKEKINKIQQEIAGLKDKEDILTKFFANEFHPAPEIVAKIKIASGKSWSQLRDIYNER